MQFTFTVYSHTLLLASMTFESQGCSITEVKVHQELNLTNVGMLIFSKLIDVEHLKRDKKHFLFRLSPGFITAGLLLVDFRNVTTHNLSSKMEELVKQIDLITRNEPATAKSINQTAVRSSTGAPIKLSKIFPWEIEDLVKFIMWTVSLVSEQNFSKLEILSLINTCQFATCQGKPYQYGRLIVSQRWESWVWNQDEWQSWLLIRRRHSVLEDDQFSKSVRTLN